MKRLSFLLLLLISFMACKKDNKAIVANKWKYDTDQMMKVTSEYLKEHPSKDVILKSYNEVFLGKYRDVSYDFNENGKLVWDDHGKILKGKWSLADHDSTIVTDLDTMTIKYRILEITPEKMVWDDNVMNEDKKFRLSKPILVPVK